MQGVDDPYQSSTMLHPPELSIILAVPHCNEQGYIIIIIIIVCMMAWPTLTGRGGSGQVCIPSSYKTVRTCVI